MKIRKSRIFSDLLLYIQDIKKNYCILKCTPKVGHNFWGALQNLMFRNSLFFVFSSYRFVNFFMSR